MWNRRKKGQEKEGWYHEHHLRSSRPELAMQSLNCPDEPLLHLWNTKSTSVQGLVRMNSACAAFPNTAKRATAAEWHLLTTHSSCSCDIIDRTRCMGCPRSSMFSSFYSLPPPKQISNIPEAKSPFMVLQLPWEHLESTVYILSTYTKATAAADDKAAQSSWWHHGLTGRGSSWSFLLTAHKVLKAGSISWWSQ